MLGTFSTIDNSQTAITIPFKTRDDFLLIVPFASARRFSSYFGGNVYEHISDNHIESETDYNGDSNLLAYKIQVMLASLESTKNEFNLQVQNFLESMQNDEPLQNSMKVANIEGIINFNLEEVLYAS